MTCCGISSKQTCRSISSKSLSVLVLHTNTGYLYVRRGKTLLEFTPLCTHYHSYHLTLEVAAYYLLSTAAVSLWHHLPPGRGPEGHPPPQPERPLPSAASRRPCPGELGDSRPAQFCIRAAKTHTQKCIFVLITLNRKKTTNRCLHLCSKAVPGLSEGLLLLGQFLASSHCGQQRHDGTPLLIEGHQKGVQHLMTKIIIHMLQPHHRTSSAKTQKERLLMMSVEPAGQTRTWYLSE